MRLIMYCTLLLSIVACNRTEEKPRVLTSLQQEYLASAPLEVRVYMEDCLVKAYYSYSYCMEEAKTMSSPPLVGKESTTSSILKTAAGTAIGIGVSRAILGK